MKSFYANSNVLHITTRGVIASSIQKPGYLQCIDLLEESLS